MSGIKEVTRADLVARLRDAAHNGYGDGELLHEAADALTAPAVSEAVDRDAAVAVCRALGEAQLAAGWSQCADIAFACAERIRKLPATLRAAIAAQPREERGDTPETDREVSRIERDCDDAENGKGMRVGLPRVTVDSHKMRRVIELCRRIERSRLSAQVGAGHTGRDGSGNYYTDVQRTLGKK